MPTDTQTVIDRHDRTMSPNYGRYPLVMERGEGCRLWDAAGKEYLDMFAGFGGPLLGHCHPELVQAVTEQAQKLWHVGNLLHTEPQTLLAEHIFDKGFGGQSYFCHSGADANEAALKLTRLFGKANPGPSGDRFKIISAAHSFHGRSFGTMRATGQAAVSEHFDPLPPGYVHVPFNDLSAIEKSIDDQTVAVLLEPIQGEGGVNLPSDDFLPQLRKLCDDRNLLLIMDEVWTGCGRTGKYFAHQHWQITPDIMTLAKGVGGGLAVGVMCARPEHAELFNWRKYGKAVHATTLGGNCLSMAVAAKIFDILERDRLVDRAEQLGERIKTRLRAFAQNHPFITDVRGKGLFVGIQLNAAAGGAWFENAKQVADRCLERGLLINATQGTILRLAPALTIGDDEIDRGLSTLEAVLTGA